MEDTNLSRRRLLVGVAASAAAGAGLGAARAAGQEPKKAMTPALGEADRAAIEAALGKKGTYVGAQETFTVPLPRNDLKVTIKGEPVPIPFGFGGWVSVKRTLDGKAAVLMSDTVLLQEEVNGLIDAAQANGLEVSAIHNHFFYEEPRVFYMHVHGMGDPADLGRRYAAAIRATKLFPANQPAPAPAPAETARTGKELFDVPALDRIVGHAAAVNGPTVKYTVGRDDLFVTAMNAHLTAAIGLNTWASFAGTAERAHVAGDYAMLEPEVNPVIRSLRKSGIEVVATHHHMLGDSPRVVFLHYYGRGPAPALARAFRTALDELGRHGGGKGMKMVAGEAAHG